MCEEDEMNLLTMISRDREYDYFRVGINPKNISERKMNEYFDMFRSDTYVAKSNTYYSENYIQIGKILEEKIQKELQTKKYCRYDIEKALEKILNNIENIEKRFDSFFSYNFSLSVELMIFFDVDYFCRMMRKMQDYYVGIMNRIVEDSELYQLLLQYVREELNGREVPIDKNLDKKIYLDGVGPCFNISETWFLDNVLTIKEYLYDFKGMIKKGPF